MNLDQFLDLAKKRRSIRLFKPGPPIPDETVMKILEAGRWAMSGGNHQPWQFIVVRDEKTRNKIADAIIEPEWEILAIEETRQPEMMHPKHGRKPETDNFRTAQLLIIVLGDRRHLQGSAACVQFIPGPEEANGVYLQSIANACHNICLAVTAAGYACEWATTVRGWEAAIKDILDIPRMLDVFTVIPVGYPAYTPTSVYRRELSEIVHFEKYDKSKYRSGKEIVEWVKHLRKMTTPDYRKAETVQK